ncbi:hypothetical protein DLM78_14025 [Leptospira stimsonii]|uniref:Uncharacterized protein n=1 Tax=Leptospira stimsonii TaxID=2202203 RepID=A0A8B3CNS9_9LEPT|nr:hypothetical protein DLM78_14025 [Leptospira stimsonii]
MIFEKNRNKILKIKTFRRSFERFLLEEKFRSYGLFRLNSFTIRVWNSKANYILGFSFSRIELTIFQIVLLSELQ